VAKAHIHVNRSLPLAAQSDKGHNRWHPDIAPTLRISSGTEVEIETLDAMDGQVRPGMKSAALLGTNPRLVHPLTGPVYIEGAEPGDLLAIEIDRIVTADRGFTVILPDFGFLRDLFPKPFVVHWEMANGIATSEDIPGVCITGAPFMGVMGLAPSYELLRRINSREAELLSRGGRVAPPDAADAVPAHEPIASEAIRTIAPHEMGGNMDIKQLVAGSTLYLPVYVPGALFSTGDAHFAQGDGESCGTAIETSATLIARFELLKGEACRRGQTDPSFTYVRKETAPPIATAPRFFATTGNSVRKDGRNESEDLNIAARNALLNMIDYIVDSRGYTREQAYCLASVAVDLKVSQVVDTPNFIVSAILPLDIFE
jgi:formamidase